MAGDLFKAAQVGKGHIDAAFVSALQHEHGQLFFLRQLDNMLVDFVGADHFPQQQDACQVRDFESRHKLAQAFLPAGFNAAPVKSNAERKELGAFGDFNQPPQHQVQVFNILPGCAYGDNPAIITAHYSFLQAQPVIVHCKLQQRACGPGFGPLQPHNDC